MQVILALKETLKRKRWMGEEEEKDLIIWVFIFPDKLFYKNQENLQ